MSRWTSLTSTLESLPVLEFDYACSGQIHRVRITGMSLELLDHDVENEMALVVLGSAAPKCIQLLTAWTTPSVDSRSLGPLLLSRKSGVLLAHRFLKALRSTRMPSTAAQSVGEALKRTLEMRQALEALVETPEAARARLVASRLVDEFSEASPVVKEWVAERVRTILDYGVWRGDDVDLISLPTVWLGEHPWKKSDLMSLVREGGMPREVEAREVLLSHIAGRFQANKRYTEAGTTEILRAITWKPRVLRERLLDNGYLVKVRARYEVRIPPAPPEERTPVVQRDPDRRVSSRDIQICEALLASPSMPTSELRTRFFTSATGANTRLFQLYRAGFLERDRKGQEWHYRLGVRGRALLGIHSEAASE